MSWYGWLAIIGGILAVVSQWWPVAVSGNYWLPVIGGALAIIAGVAEMMK